MNRQRNNRYNHGKQGGGHTSISLPDIKSYVDEDDKLRPQLFDKEAEDTAKAMGDISYTQVRRFFGLVMADKRRFDLLDDVKDNEAKVAMAMLKAKTAYASMRNEKNKPLAEFAANHAKLVSGIDDFRNFTRHFEAVIAWHKVHGKK